MRTWKSRPSKVQVVDKYFGRMDIILDFADENKVEINITKTAEYFLDEYVGCAIGERKDDCNRD